MNLKNYRPVMTTHYTLDWLNAFKLKDIHHLREVELQQRQPLVQTASFVNQAMSQLMHGKTAIWGIKQTNSDQFLGTFSLFQIDLPNRAATVQASLLMEGSQTELLTEVVPHILRMLQTDLKFQTIFVPQVQEKQFAPALAELKFEKSLQQKQPQIVEYSYQLK
ncbi:hypothetical protein [Ligilactobacillus pabuli]|nr:hypothetical protein [Ligilactobacillus pabuli]